MCGNDVLKERIDNLITTVDGIATSLDAHILREETNRKGLTDDFVTRREFKAVKAVWGVVLGLIGGVATIFALLSNK